MNKRFEAALVEQCAPTLAGVKAANLFCFKSEHPSSVRAAAAEWNQKLEPRGICVQILRECPTSHTCTIYVYRRKWVARILKSAANLSFLRTMGYSPSDMDGMLRQLSSRLCLKQEYPHEIGLFLGYPLRDVIGFIENHGQNYTCCGCWKSYSDPVAARKYFDCCHTYTSIYKQLYVQGTPIIHLVAAA